MEYLAAIAILAFVGFLAFRRKDLLTQKSNVDPGISKVFLILLFLVPVVIVALYVMKMQNQGLSPMNNEFNLQKQQQYQEPTIPKQDEGYYDAPAGRIEG